jgi:hypothetical protein
MLESIANPDRTMLGSIVSSSTNGEEKTNMLACVSVRGIKFSLPFAATILAALAEVGATGHSPARSAAIVVTIAKAESIIMRRIDHLYPLAG